MSRYLEGEILVELWGRCAARPFSLRRLLLSRSVMNRVIWPPIGLEKVEWLFWSGDLWIHSSNVMSKWCAHPCY